MPTEITTTEKTSWQVRCRGRKYGARNRDEAVELLKQASLRVMGAELWKVVVTERTETTEVENPYV